MTGPQGTRHAHGVCPVCTRSVGGKHLPDSGKVRIRVHKPLGAKRGAADCAGGQAVVEMTWGGPK